MSCFIGGLLLVLLGNFCELTDFFEKAKISWECDTSPANNWMSFRPNLFTVKRQQDRGLPSEFIQLEIHGTPLSNHDYTFHFLVSQKFATAKRIGNRISRHLFLGMYKWLVAALNFSLRARTMALFRQKWFWLKLPFHSVPTNLVPFQLSLPRKYKQALTFIAPFGDAHLSYDK